MLGRREAGPAPDTVLQPQSKLPLSGHNSSSPRPPPSEFPPLRTPHADLAACPGSAHLLLSLRLALGHIRPAARAVQPDHTLGPPLCSCWPLRPQAPRTAARPGRLGPRSGPQSARLGHEEAGALRAPPGSAGPKLRARLSHSPGGPVHLEPPGGGACTLPGPATTLPVPRTKGQFEESGVTGCVSVRLEDDILEFS